MKGFLRTIAMLSLLNLMVDTLLPQGAMHKLCDLILGLVLMLCMLCALKEMLFGGMAG